MGDQLDPNEAKYIPQNNEGLTSFEGYNNVGYQYNEPLPPPPPPADMHHGAPPDMTFGTGADISQEEARQAMLNFVAENCCYGKGPAEEMQITDIKPSNAFHYVLETYCEARKTKRKEVPYHNEPVDGPFNGPPPQPWAIPCAPKATFVNEVVKMPVPHTEEVRTCGRCMGSGSITCGRCNGCGRDRCAGCGGDGRVTRMEVVDGHHRSTTHMCHRCGGSGRDVCDRCHGSGRVRCSHCQGTGRVKNFIQLIVTYTNHMTDYVLEVSDMPDHLVSQVQGVQIFEQTLPQVWPITSFTVREVNENSVRLVDSARMAYPSERQLCQRQTLRVVPVSEVDYTYKESKLRYWVYGMERKVYSPDYPQQCCWGCNIL